MIYAATVEGRAVHAEVRAGSAEGRYLVLVDGRALDVDVREAGLHGLSLLVEGRSHDVALERRGGGYRVALRGRVLDVALVEGEAAVAPRTARGPARVLAPMPGKLVRVLVTAGQKVDAGQGLVVMEAMKMENEIRAPRAGTVKDAPVREGQAVETGTLLVLLD